jgi:hypothetical protein
MEEKLSACWTLYEKSEAAEKECPLPGTPTSSVNLVWSPFVDQSVLLNNDIMIPQLSKNRFIDVQNPLTHRTVLQGGEQTQHALSRAGR